MFPSSSPYSFFLGVSEKVTRKEKERHTIISGLPQRASAVAPHKKEEAHDAAPQLQRCVVPCRAAFALHARAALSMCVCVCVVCLLTAFLDLGCIVLAGKNFSMKSEEDMEELMQTLIAQIQLKLKNELNLREIFIPNSKAEAKCNIFVSSNYATCPKLCVFLQPGAGNDVVLIYFYVAQTDGLLIESVHMCVCVHAYRYAAGNLEPQHPPEDWVPRLDDSVLEDSDPGRVRRCHFESEHELDDDQWPSRQDPALVHSRGPYRIRLEKLHHAECRSGNQFHRARHGRDPTKDVSWHAFIQG